MQEASWAGGWAGCLEGLPGQPALPSATATHEHVGKRAHRLDEHHGSPEQTGAADLACAAPVQVEQATRQAEHLQRPGRGEAAARRW